MHSLQLRFHLCERLEVEPFHNGGSCALRLFPGFLDAQRETMLHDLHERPLSRFGHVFREILNDRIFSQCRLEISVCTKDNTYVSVFNTLLIR